MSDALLALLTGILGYGLGRAPFQEWEGFIKEYKERLGYLTYLRITEPLTFYHKVGNADILYSEAVFTYLLGLPNASLPTTFRCLELGLKQHYEEVEGKKPSLSAYELIEWSEKRLRSKKELAHGFRFLRNLIHGEKIIEEQDALEAIRHVTRILNYIFPFPTAHLTGSCVFCGNAYSFEIPPKQCYLGNPMPIQCNRCRKTFNHFILPKYPQKQI